MPHFDSHSAGSFNWIELATSDPKAAQAFYGQLFNWQVEEQPMGPDEVYTLFRIEGRDAAAGYKMRPEEAAAAPPHWNLYLTVENADLTAAKAAELGGTVLMGPFDVMGHGRMAVIADPTGAVFCAWQPLSHIGVGVKDEAGALCWADLSTNDPARAMGFYHHLLGWTYMQGEDNYQHIQNGETFIGGIPPAQFRDPNLPAHWLVYFQVDDCAASAEKARLLGGNVLVGPFSMDNVGEVAVVCDPQGAVFSLFQPVDQPES